MDQESLICDTSILAWPPVQFAKLLRNSFEKISLRIFNLNKSDLFLTTFPASEAGEMTDSA